MDLNDYRNLMYALNTSPTKQEEYHSYVSLTKYLSNMNPSDLSREVLVLIKKYHIDRTSLPLIHSIVRSKKPHLLYYYLKHEDNLDIDYDIILDMEMPCPHACRSYVSMLKIFRHFRITIPQIEYGLLQNKNPSFQNWLIKNNFVTEEEAEINYTDLAVQSVYAFFWGTWACKVYPKVSKSSMYSYIFQLTSSIYIIYRGMQSPYMFPWKRTINRCPYTWYIPYAVKYIMCFIYMEPLQLVNSPLLCLAYRYIVESDDNIFPTQCLLFGIGYQLYLNDRHMVN